MTTIRVSCPDCGNVDLDPSEIRLTVVHGTRASERYDFRCPSCDVRVVKPADGRVAQLLRTTGVPVDVHEARLVTAHPETPPAGPPLGWDDLLDLMLLLERDDWYERSLGADV